MILVASKESFFDCYVQRLSIQNGLLKSIRYSTFEVFVQTEIVDEWIIRMNISGIDFTRFLLR